MANRLRKPYVGYINPGEFKGFSMRALLSNITRVLLVSYPPFKSFAIHMPSHDDFPLINEGDCITLLGAGNHATTSFGLCKAADFGSLLKVLLILGLIP